MEDFIKMYLSKKTLTKKMLKMTYKLPAQDKLKIRMLYLKKSWREDWRILYKNAEDKKYIELNFALMLYHSDKIISWDTWKKHKKFITQDIYEKLNY